MKVIDGVALFPLVMALMPQVANAGSSVLIDGYDYYCEHTCVVSVGSNGGLEVSDSAGGWVRIFTRSGRLPVPRT